MKVFVANIGVISALGLGVEKNLSELLDMKHGITCFDEDTGYPVGKVRLNDDELCKISGIRAGLPRTSLLALCAANECLTGGEFRNAQPIFNSPFSIFNSDCKLGYISGTTVGGMSQSEYFFKDYVPRTGKAKIRDIIYHTCGSATVSIIPYLPKLAYVSTINTACSSSANAIILGAQKIKAGHLDAVIAGGSDSLCRFTLNGFRSLMILDKNHCKPLDAARAGLNLGEGAGYLLLVSEKYVEKNCIKPLCELKSYANANDAFHATALSDEGKGPFLAMSQTLEKSGISTTEVDYINLHGTGTKNNDLAESAAILRLFGEKYPALSSTKAFTGHTLGASGGIEAVFSVLAIREQKIFPNLNFSESDLGLNPVTSVKSQKIRFVMSNSFGFGGNCSSLLFG